MSRASKIGALAGSSQTSGEAWTARPLSDPGRRAILALLVAATFLVFFQAFMIAPLIPRLAHLFHSSANVVALAVPAYLVPYGAMTLVWGPLSDRTGRARVIMGSLAAFVVLTAATAATPGAGLFIVARLVTALGASGVVPISLALLADLVPYERRGQALGWLFGAMAGGIAFGSTAGALLEPVIGWRGLFIGVAALGAIVLSLLARRRDAIGWKAPGAATPATPAAAFRLLGEPRARRTFAFVLLNAMVHSGVYTWLGVYFARRYGLSEVKIGLALLGYGIPGFILGPLIGRVADQRGRARLIPLGLAVGAAAALLLAVHLPVIAAAAIVTLLSLGYDLTQPLLAGIATQLSQARGQAMGLNVFTLFVGFGLGSLVFQGALSALGFAGALEAFGAAALVSAVVAVPIFRDETRPAGPVSRRHP